MNPSARVDRPRVIAHRGASGYRPENTLVAMELAHAQGAEWIECDVVLTRDQELLVLHDLELDLLTDVATRYPDRARADGRYYAADFNLAELEPLRVAERLVRPGGPKLYPDRFPTPPEPQPMPSFTAWLDHLHRLNRAAGRVVGPAVELKAPLHDATATRELTRLVAIQLAAHGYDAPTSPGLLMSFSPGELHWLRREAGWTGPLLQLIGPAEWGFDSRALTTPEGLAEVATYASWLGPHLPQVATLAPHAPPRPTGLIAAAHAAGLRVAAYTFHPEGLPTGLTLPDLLAYAAGPLGLDGIISDFPDLAVAAARDV
jgi:glycerophosphoryl diester phosphodiesterase